MSTPRSGRPGEVAVIPSGRTGATATDLTTHATAADPEEFAAGLSPRPRVDDGMALLELIGHASESEPRAC